MVRILLTSNGFYTVLIKEQFLQLIEKELSTNNATIITTASLQKENNQFAIKAKNDLMAMGIKEVDFTDIELEMPEKLAKYSVIYINGGNPFFLLFHMKKSGTDLILKELAKRNVIIVGVSAGSVILGPNIEVVDYLTPQMNTIGLNDFSALGIIDKIIFPHYDREDLFPATDGKTIEERLREFEIMAKCEVVRVADDQVVLVSQ